MAEPSGEEMRRACVFVPLSLSCSLPLLIVCWMLHQPARLVPVHAPRLSTKPAVTLPHTQHRALNGTDLSGPQTPPLQHKHLRQEEHHHEQGGQSDERQEEHHHEQEGQPDKRQEEHHHKQGGQSDKRQEEHHHEQGGQSDERQEEHHHEQGGQPDKRQEEHHHEQGGQSDKRQEEHHHKQGGQSDERQEPTVRHNNSRLLPLRQINGDMIFHSARMLTPNEVSRSPRPHIELHLATAKPGTRFEIHSDFHFPHPRAVRTVREILQSDWLQKLKATLHTMPTTQVTMVTSNLPYKDVLLNWLISAVGKASIPLTSILVVAMDSPLHRLLQERGINSVLVTPDALLSRETQAMGTFTQVMMTRLALLRLLNHWGLNVAFYDTDAVLLKDPQPVLDRHRASGIVGVMGKFPTALYKTWGVALCTAVMLVRSSTSTEYYWEATSKVQPGSFSDQERMNYGLQALHIKWQGGGGGGRKEASGLCQNGLSVTLLPYSFACRSNCKRSEKGSYYVWHKGGPRDRDSKMKNAGVGGVWFLSNNWNSVCREGRGLEWLRCIASPPHT